MAGSAGAPAGSGPGGAAGSGGAPPTWGIETRPTGQTCLPPATRDAAALLLSATGCADPMDPTRPAATLIPYDVASALWSDAAEKTRFFALPDGTKIQVKDCARNPMQCLPIEEGGTYEDEGDWIFPIGTVFVKTFAFGGQTDADLVPGDGDFINGKDVMIEGPDGPQTWHFPSRSECMTCHTSPAGVALGPETPQLNGDFTYPNGVTGNQIETLEHIDVFEAAPVLMEELPDPADTAAPLEERARAYLHANCSMCHREGSTFTGFDARFSLTFAEMRLCNIAPEKGDLGVTGAMRITPGDASASVVSLRMHTRDLGMQMSVQMPLIGTNVVDDDGVGVIDEWIESLTGCP
jgi:hypothetical protein